jgi:hypothetical protein
MLRASLYILVLVFLSGTGHAQTPPASVKTGPPPAWTDLAKPEARAAGANAPYGQAYLLFDKQVNAAASEVFIRVVKEIVSEAGVQSGANLSFSFDPSYQELVVHEVSIQRGSERLERLDPAKFRVIQKETDLNRQVYNGTLSALLFLDDVRVGDQIEYAFTVRGFNPVLRGKYSEMFLSQMSIPVERLRFRLLWPSERLLSVQNHGTAVQPQITVRGDTKEYLWDLHHLPAIAVEDQVPSWYSAYGWVQLSEYRSWADVVEWAAGLYASTNTDAPALKEQISSLRKPGTPEQTIQAALDFVQGNVRYLGIEFGPNSYHPTDPATVLSRRFGDCKDKSFLLCTLLRGLGFEASPVLIATGFRQTLADLLPAPHDFDHAIVRVTANGKDYWIDPTASYQRGPIGQRSLPDYGYGLVIRTGERGLTAIPISDAESMTMTMETFTVGGQKAPALLEVVNTYKGSDAESMRAYIAASGSAEIENSYLNDYSRRYPGIYIAQPMVIQDSPTRDEVSIRYEYTITNFWRLSEDKHKYLCSFYPLGIHYWINKPATTTRSMPMELAFPHRRTVRTKIQLPIVFKVTNATNVIAGPGAELRIDRSYTDRTVWLDYEYRALTNFIPTSQIASHFKSLDRMEDAIGYSLSWQNPEFVATVPQFNLPILLLGGIYGTAFLVAAFLFCRWQFKLAAATPSPPPIIADLEITGLGGWLILVAIGMFLSPLRIIATVARTSANFGLWRWRELTTPGGQLYHPGWAPCLIFELLGQITLIVLCVVALVLFFQKRRLFPRWYIGILLTNAVFVITDSLIAPAVLRDHLAQSPDAHIGPLMGVFVGCAIWIPYMFQSRRVKATFIR